MFLHYPHDSECNITVFYVIDREGFKIRDEEIIRYIQKVNNSLLFNLSFLLLNILR